MSILAAAKPPLWLPRFEPWRLLRPLNMDGQFFARQRLELSGDDLPANIGPPSGGGGSLDLTYVGHGTNTAPVSSNATLNYSTVTAGSAPSAGDLVLYAIRTFNTSGSSSFASPSGWEIYFNITPGSGYKSVMTAKLVESSDISSPPAIITSCQYSNGGWIAARPSASATLRTPVNYDALASNATGDPAAVSIDESGEAAPGIIASFHITFGGSMDGGWTGDTPTKTATDDDGFDTWDFLAKVYTASDGTGVSVTADSGDNGSANWQVVGSAFLDAA